MKFLFLSRHQLTAEQIEDLRVMGYTDFESVNPGVLTRADDVIRLAREYGADGVGLVAPGRVWAELVYVARVHYEDNVGDPRGPLGFGLYEAESRQAPELRVGDGPIPFAHVKWHRVV